MLNELLKQLRSYEMVSAGDRVICAVSGGADSVSLLWAMYLLREKLDIRLEAAHFNHHLRGEESDRDEAFVRDFCSRFDIPLTVGQANVTPGKKGLEAAAREARYAFLETLPGKIATAHTADDNAETVVMHLIRGTGLKGLGGIAPVSGKLIRPMLTVTRRQVEEFLSEYHLSYVQDSSNDTDAFLRNRIRHRVMPLLKEENPKLAENVSQMAMRLRQDEETLAALTRNEADIPTLQAMPAPLRRRYLAEFLTECGVKEPESAHILQAEALLFSDNPSARATFPGSITIRRNYDRLEPDTDAAPLPCIKLTGEGTAELTGFTVSWQAAQAIVNTPDTFTVAPVGSLCLRPRQTGDEIRLNAGTRTLKKLFIDRKIPAAIREQIPILADDLGVIGVYGIGIHLDRIPKNLPAVQIRILKTET